MIDIKKVHDNVVITINDPPANVITSDLCVGLKNAINNQIDADCKAIILTAPGRIFSAGVDLVELFNGPIENIAIFLNHLEQLLEALFFCPKPVVAAINGHAIAGGCIIASCADYRIMVSGKARIGVPELRVGVPFPVIIMEIMRARVHSACFERIILDGETFLPEQALQLGLIDEIVEPDDLFDTASKKAVSLASIRPEIYSFTKQQLRTPVRDATNTYEKRYKETINALWCSEQTQQAIASYVEQTLKK